MNEVLVYGSTLGFFIAVFPIHVFNYLYISTEQKYASANVCIYRLFTVLNVNTIKNKPTSMQVNGSEKKMNLQLIKGKQLKIFNNLCITKIVQLIDCGVNNEKNVYAVLAQNALTGVAYAFCQMNGGKTKLRNYIVLNYEKDTVNYYMKLVGVINIISVSKLFLILLWEKLNER